MRNWRQALVFLHRWLGMIGILMFVAWFGSGLVMIYARMPGLAREEQLARAPSIDLSSATISPAEAAERFYLTADHVVVSMRGPRPVYAIGRGRGATLVFADTGETFAGLSTDDAMWVARPFAPPGTALTYVRHLTEPDQWTLQDRARMPMHVFNANDPAGTTIYVSEVTGTAVLRSTRSERVWGYLGPVIHWMYFTPLRRSGSLWGQVVIWSSVVGCVIAMSGLLWGALRYAPRAKYRYAGKFSSSPYRGLLKWHHYAGLIFGVATLTWAYSGLLSVEPFGWFASEGVTQAQREALTGASPPDGSLPRESLTLEQIRQAVDALGEHGRPKEIESVVFRGQLYWAADQHRGADDKTGWTQKVAKPRVATPPMRRRYLSAAALEASSFHEFNREELAQAAREALPGITITAEEWIDRYDSYYYDPAEGLNLPVLRVKYADAAGTWLYLDPKRGAIVAKYQNATRRQRWLYHGLHSLDFPALYYKRPLWDVVVIGLSLGGMLSALTAIVPAWRRITGLVAQRRMR